MGKREFLQCGSWKPLGFQKFREYGSLYDFSPPTHPNMSINHVAIIPDGNRRWAKNKNLPAFFGHREGAIVMGKIFEKVAEMKIPFFSFWGASLDNVKKRSKEEVSFLFGLFENHFRDLINNPKIHDNQVHIRAIGRWREIFPKNLKNVIEEAIEKTKNYDKFNLTALLAYDGKDEIIEATKSVSGKKINENSIKKSLWTKELPAVDLVIRTGGEPHWSAGFMMWDVAEAALHFTETLWPDFTPEEFEKIVLSIGKIERRLGK